MNSQVCSVEGCDRCDRRRGGLVKGMCQKHYTRVRKFGSTELPARPSVAERFWAKVVPDGTCLRWAGAHGGRGYGSFNVDGAIVKAHRWAWEEANGPVPDGLQLDHLCRNKLCVNPAHLEPVTQRENILRGTAPTALAARKTHCPQGHPYAGANLYVLPDGARRCRQCARERMRRKTALRRAQREAA